MRRSILFYSEVPLIRSRGMSYLFWTTATVVARMFCCPFIQFRNNLFLFFHRFSRTREQGLNFWMRIKCLRLTNLLRNWAHLLDNWPYQDGQVPYVDLQACFRSCQYFRAIIDGTKRTVVQVTTVSAFEHPLFPWPLPGGVSSQEAKLVSATLPFCFLGCCQIYAAVPSKMKAFIIHSLMQQWYLPRFVLFFLPRYD